MIKINNIIKIILSVLLINTIQQNLHASTTIDAKLDSVSILMGMQTKLHYQIIQDEKAVGHFYGEESQKEFIAPNVEIVGKPTNDTTFLGNNRIQIDRTVIIQSFDSGVWEIPAAKFVIDKDTFLSQKLNLKVVPVVTSDTATIENYKPVEGVETKFSDYIPNVIYYYWWIILIAILVIAALILIIISKKRGRPILSIKKKEVPPYEEAISALQKLKEQKLWQSGNEKEYFTALTDIMRRYIDRRFNINAIEMTSSQIIETLKKNEETKNVNNLVKEILSIADYVKFTNIKSLPDDNELALQKATEFVENTKPVIIAENTEQKDVTQENKAKEINNDNFNKNKHN